MQTEIVLAGFGGQGVLFAGQMLSYAAMDSNLNTTWFPSYGPEMRGGTANCTVIISDEEIGAPVVHHPRALLVMNLPSLIKYEDTVIPGGVLALNTTFIHQAVKRKDLTVIPIPANEIAENLGDKHVANMVMLGGLLASLAVLPIEVIETTLERHLPDHLKKTLPLNIKALNEGAKIRAN